jgi:phosphoribosylaminoimidazole carboxylase (NCAIR synthetase)
MLSVRLANPAGKGVDVLTMEIEHINTDALTQAAAEVKVRGPRDAGPSAWARQRLPRAAQWRDGACGA